MALADLFRSTRLVARSSRRGGRGSTSSEHQRSDPDRAQTNPDREELRQRRVAYYSSTAEQRRRLPAGTKSVRSGLVTSAKVGVQPKGTLRRTTKTTGRSAAQSTVFKVASTKPQRRRDDVGRGAGCYVYGQPPDQHIQDAQHVSESDRPIPRANTRSSRRISPTLDENLPMINDAELTPDDSISQVLERSHGSGTRTDHAVRPTLGGRRMASRKVETVRQVKATERSTPTRPTRETSRRKSAVSALSMPRRWEPQAPQLVDCLTCGSDDIPNSKSAKLQCGHRMCHACLKRLFELSVKDPAHMPPKCCTDQHIPLKHVDKLFGTTFKLLWNRKYQEYNTRNRIYCPNLKCGEWIKPSHIHKQQGRTYAHCPRCGTKVCTLCCNRLHKTRDCPKDPEIARLVEQAKDRGWQRCYSCQAMVEKKEGCNHMTCRCSAEFCMVCGAKWKTCDCTWFDYTGLPNPDRLNDMRIPEPVHVMLRHVFRAVANPPHLDEFIRDRPEPGGTPNQRRDIPANNRQEQHDRRRQEALDADLARRLQLAMMLNMDDEQPHERPLEMPGAFHNAAGHFALDNSMQNGAALVVDAPHGATANTQGERSTGRRRRARQTVAQAGEAGHIETILEDLGMGRGRV